jgi:transcription initiation factor TFIIH subunit 4
LKEWDLSDGLSRHKATLDMLSQLEVFIEVSNRKKESSYRLNPKFQSQLCKEIMNGGPPLREPMPPNVDADLISFLF